MALLWCVGDLGAQTVRGTVHWPDSTPVLGALVVVRVAPGGEPVRTLTGGRGTFALHLPAAGRYGMSVLRIGFEPTVLPDFDVSAGETHVVDVVMRAAPVRLARVSIREGTECRVNPDSGLMVARAWEQARRALLTTRLSASGLPLVGEWINYQRTLDASGRYVRKQEVHAVRAPTAHVFESVPAARLATDGYVTDSMAYAPDADVLLSDSFAATHCLKLVSSPPDRPGMIGVGFEPTPARATIPDISGTFWIDTSTSELRALDFHYTRMGEEAIAAGAGGTLRFLRLADGEWLVSEWAVRLPKLAEQGRVALTGALSRVERRAKVVGFEVTGGAVNRVLRGDSVLYAATGAALHVQVVAQDSMVAVRGARLTLAGTDYAATSDTSGRILVAPVLEGRFVARVTTPLMDSLGIKPVEADVEATARAHVDSVTLPSARDMLLAACPRDSVRHGEALLRGTVRSEAGRLLSGAAITVTWHVPGETAGDATERTLGALSDGGGWRICGVPRGTPLAVRVTSDSGSDGRDLQIDAGHALGAVDLIARAGVIASRDSPSASRALVEFMVSGPGGSALGDATLSVSLPDGRTRVVITNAGGQALLPDALPGTLHVRVRRIGLTPGQVAVRVEAGRNTVPIRLTAASLPALDTVRIMGDRRIDARFDEFDTRHLRHEATASLDESEIAQRDPLETWQLFRTLPGVRMMKDSLSGAMLPASSRGLVHDYTTGKMMPCLLTVYIDGVPADPSFDLRDLPPPSELHGVEVFAGAASIPLRYAGTVMNDRTCGVIAIWRK